MLLWRPPGSAIEIFARAGVDAVRRRLDGIALDDATVHATLHAPPRLTLVPFRRAPIALVSLRGSALALDAAREALTKLPGRVEAWHVDESVPVARTSHAAATLLTLFRRSPAIDEPLFRTRWFDEHTPMTLEVHPVIGYVRNVVLSALAPGSAPWDGIVTEDFAEERDLVTLRLFGRGPRALVNAMRVGRHVRSFLDLKTIETYLVTERRL
jgi:hypothetical protein